MDLRVCKLIIGSGSSELTFSSNKFQQNKSSFPTKNPAHTFSDHHNIKILYNKWDFKSHYLTHSGRETHICAGNLTTIGSDKSLSPSRCQAIIWTNDWALLIGHFSKIFLKLLTFPFKKIRLKVSFAKWRPFCLDLNMLTLVMSTNMRSLYGHFYMLTGQNVNIYKT